VDLNLNLKKITANKQNKKISFYYFKVYFYYFINATYMYKKVFLLTALIKEKMIRNPKRQGYTVKCDFLQLYYNQNLSSNRYNI
jgi:hypothetical protein